MDNWVRMANALDGSDRIAELEGEVEWLQGQVEALRVKAARADELQAKIDALDVARRNTSTDRDWWAAIDALRAAATKEDDRG